MSRSIGITREAAQIIKNKLSMRDVLIRYGYTPKRRIKCPLHNGNGENFEVREKTYTCYSHCGSGDVINFVQKMFGLDFPDTLKKIDTDFALGLYGTVQNEDLRQQRWKAKAAEATRSAIYATKKKLNEEYWKAFDEWARLDRNKILYAPELPDEELHPLFIEALQNLSYKKHLLDCAEEAMNDFRNNNKRNELV